MTEANEERMARYVEAMHEALGCREYESSSNGEYYCAEHQHLWLEGGCQGVIIADSLRYLLAERQRYAALVADLRGLPESWARAVHERYCGAPPSCGLSDRSSCEGTAGSDEIRLLRKALRAVLDKHAGEQDWDPARDAAEEFVFSTDQTLTEEDIRRGRKVATEIAGEQAQPAPEGHAEVLARAILPLADEERAADRAEVERLREEVRHLEDGFEEGSAQLADLHAEVERLRSAELDAAAHRHCLEAIAASPAPEATTSEGIYWLTEQVERWKAKYQQEWMRAENATRNLAESTPVFRGWRSFSDGSRTGVERWVRAADGDWVSLDSERRTDGDIILEHFSCAPDPDGGDGGE